MIINHNLASMNTYRQYSINNNAMSSSLEKLSSGLKINSAADDAAGLAISEKMRGQIRGLDQASNNAQDGISMIQTAEGGLSETQSILQRMRELATQASNDTNTTDDRAEIQKEMNQLTSEINRIGNTTEFNTQKLLKGSTATGAASAVTTTTAGTTGSATAVTGTASALTANGLTITASGNDDAYNGFAVTLADGTTEGIAVDYDAKTITLTLDLTNGASSDISSFTATTSGTNPGAGSFSFSGDASSLGASDAGVLGTTAGGADDVAAGVGTKGVYTFDITTNLADKETITIGGKTYTGVTGTPATGSDEFQIGTDVSTTETALAAKIAADTENTFTAAINGSSIELTQRTAAAGAAPTVTIAADFTSKLQIGANTGQSFSVSINDMRADALDVSSAKASDTKSVTVDGKTYTAQYTASTSVSNGTDDTNVEYALDISTSDNATAAIQVIDDAINSVSAERSKLGAYQNRLEHTISNLGTSSENMTAAESRIRDVDMAKEMMNYQKTSVLQQAAQAMLAQANQQPQSVLKLLQ